MQKIKNTENKKLLIVRGGWLIAYRKIKICVRLTEKNATQRINIKNDKNDTKKTILKLKKFKN